MFEESVAKEEMKRLMLGSDSQAQPFKLMDFGRGLVVETIDRGGNLKLF